MLIIIIITIIKPNKYITIYTFLPNRIFWNTHTMTITAIIPAHNQEITIGTLVLKAKKHVEQVLVIDDKSTDRTVEMAQLGGAEVISLPSRMGKSSAIKAGFEYAATTDSEVIVVVDPDGEYDPEDIPELTGPIIREEADLVNAIRSVKSKGLRNNRSISGFKAFRMKNLPVFRFVLKGQETDKEMHKYAEKLGLRLVEVEIGLKNDEVKSAKTSSNGVEVPTRMIQNLKLKKPLYYFSMPGIILASYGIALGLNYLNIYNTGGSLSYGSMLLMILFILVGSFMAFSGMILHSMSRMINKNEHPGNRSNEGLWIEI